VIVVETAAESGSDQEYDVVVIGGGPGAGMPLPCMALRPGSRSAMIEKEKVGGTWSPSGMYPSEGVS